MIRQLITSRNCILNAVVDGVAFDGFETRTLDHFDDLLFGHFYFAFGGVGVG